jgi:hypothetical protein
MTHAAVFISELSNESCSATTRSATTVSIWRKMLLKVIFIVYFGHQSIANLSRSSGFLSAAAQQSNRSPSSTNNNNNKQQQRSSS